MSRSSVGPPPAYSAKYLAQAVEASAYGFTIYELSRLLGVHIDVIQLWDMVYAEFAEAIRAGGASRTRRVEAAMFQRAVGYEHPSEEIVVRSVRVVTISKKTGKKSIKEKLETVRIPTMKHIPSDTKAGEFWLTNNDPERYRTRRDEPSPAEKATIIVYGGIPEEDQPK